MNHLPDEWEAPAELQRPTPYPEVNLAIKLLSCEILGFDVRAAIGRFVTEEALYDVWFLQNVGSANWGVTKSAILREVPMEQTRHVYEAWKILDEVGDLDIPNGEQRERRMAASADLKVALEQAVETFVNYRKGISNIG